MAKYRVNASGGGCALVIVLMMIVTGILGVIGWCLNLGQVVIHCAEPFTTLMLVKIIGLIVAPLGAILGWVGLF